MARLRLIGLQILGWSLIGWAMTGAIFLIYYFAADVDAGDPLHLFGFRVVSARYINSKRHQGSAKP